MIKLINVDKIYHHPDNPRKNLGDLKELAESIKQSGILQNLTLVPVEGEKDKFYAVIGNRRLAASKIAGLEEVPATVRVDMDYKTQVATMLLENMQRSDLTAYEQAQGFQMMLDLGESINDISDKTGFSETTVRQRVKLLDLDQEKLKESTERGGTLTDYIELGKIESEELRNEVLETVGTDNFNYKLKSAIAEEKSIKAKSEAIKLLSSFAERINEKGSNMSYITSYYSSAFESIEVPEDSGEKKYYFKEEYYYITLYKEKEIDHEQDRKSEELEKERAEREEKRTRLEEVSRRAYDLRLEFIQGLSNTKVRRHMDEIIEATIYGMINGANMWISDIAKLLEVEVEVDEDTDIKWGSIQEVIWKQPEKNLLTLIYDSLDNEHQNYYSYNLSYSENAKLDYIYNFLEKLGFKLSEEEKQLKTGSHKLFI